MPPAASEVPSLDTGKQRVRLMLPDLVRTVVRHHELIWNFIRRDFKGRYRGSYLGFLWNLVQPVMMVHKVHMVPLVTRVHRASKVSKVQKVQKVQRVRKVSKVSKVPLVTRVHRVQRVQRVHKVHQGLKMVTMLFK